MTPARRSTHSPDEFMLLSHRHRYLFVHIAKTGGSSIRAALGRWRWRDPLYWPGVLCGHLSRLCQHRLGSKIPRHAPVLVAKEMLPPSLFEGLFKFAFVRNPWDRLVSAHYHFQREQQELLQEHKIACFHEFVDWLLHAPMATTRRASLLRALRRPQQEYLIDWHGRQLVDFVGRYERLADDFNYVVSRLGFKHMELPHKRRSVNRRDFREFYCDRLAERVGEVYAADVTAFGYRFDPSATGVQFPTADFNQGLRELTCVKWAEE